MPLSHTWRKSSYSTEFEDACVEARIADGAVLVRDSKDLRLRPLSISAAAWDAFTAVPLAAAGQ